MFIAEKTVFQICEVLNFFPPSYFELIFKYFYLRII